MFTKQKTYCSWFEQRADLCLKIREPSLPPSTPTCDKMDQAFPLSFCIMQKLGGRKAWEQVYILILFSCTLHINPLCPFPPRVRWCSISALYPWWGQGASGTIPSQTPWIFPSTFITFSSSQSYSTSLVSSPFLFYYRMPLLALLMKVYPMTPNQFSSYWFHVPPPSSCP